MTDSLRVLLVCYYFPPLGGGGVGRPLSLYKQLPEFGIECDVLTVKPVAYRAYDHSLLEGVDTSRIYRSGSRDPQRLMRLFGFKHVRISVADRAQRTSARIFPDNKVGWVRPAVRLGRTLFSSRHYAAIVSTSPPISAHLVARELSRNFKLPWIADFRDYWTSYKPEQLYDDASLRKKAKQLLDELRQDAASVVAVNKSIAEYLRTDTVIVNSYDDATTSVWDTAPDGDHFTIGMFGTYNNSLPVRPLLEVLDRLRQSAPDAFARIRLVQVGPVDEPWLRTQLREFQMEDRSDIHGFLPRHEALAAMTPCEVFYIGLRSDAEQALTTGRVYYLMASGRPVLAHVPLDGELHNLLRDYGNAHQFSSDSIEPASAWLETLVTDSTENEEFARRGRIFAQQFSSTRMVDDFARVINKAIDVK